MLNVCNIAERPKLEPPHDNGIYSFDNYFCVEPDGNWHSCREDFHSNWGHGSHEPWGFYFGCHNVYALSVMLDWVEGILNVQPKCRAKIQLCQKDLEAELAWPVSGVAKIVYINIGKFWRAEKIRRYFITILCRAARITNDWMHPLDPLLATSYCRSTRRATGMFLDGYTIRDPNGDQDTNWVELFNGPNLTRQLRRPSHSKECKFFVDGSPVPRLEPFEKWKITQWVKESEGSLSSDLTPFSF